MIKGLGRRLEWDDRNLQFIAYVPETAERKVRRTPWKLSGVYDQGYTGTCVAHCGIEGYESTPYGHKMLSWMHPYDLYRLIVLQDNWTENDKEATSPNPSDLQFGTSILALMKFYKNIAQVIPSYQWILNTDDAANYLTWQSGSPLFFGTLWTYGMGTHTAEGIVKPDGTVQGGHAYLCFWYDKRRDLFWFLNSWGRFGVANPWDKTRIPYGCFAMEGKHVQYLIERQGEVAAAREWRRVPKAAEARMRAMLNEYI